MDSEQSSSSSAGPKFMGVLPFLIFVFLVLILIISSSLSSRFPEIERISPAIAEPGDKLTITGKFFGDDKNGGRVVVSELPSPNSSILEWNDSKISLIIPEEMSGGLLSVVTDYGASREVVIFTNRRHLPVVASEYLNPGNPYITRFEPKNGPVGTLLTITGLNLGLEKGESRVDFTWISAKDSSDIDSSTFVRALDYDQDYVSWRDREIVVRVPDGASSGSIKVTTDKGESNTVYYEVKDAVGSKLFRDRRVFHVQYEIDVRTIAANPGGGLYLWVPRVLETPEQRNVKLVSVRPEPLIENFKGFMLFFLEDLQPGQNRKVILDFIFSRYAVETKVNAARVKADYDETRKLYRAFTVANSILPVGDKRIAAVASALVKKQRNPYRKAWVIYSYVANRLAYAVKPASAGVADAITTRQGDSRTYSFLFCSLARSAGIPARPVAGYLVDSKGGAHRHLWAEFYIEKFGWIPVDAALGDDARIGNFSGRPNARAYYFGNLDNQHIALSRGLVELSRMNPQGRTVHRDGIASLQTIHEEANGHLYSYTSRWSGLKLIGIY